MGWLVTAPAALLFANRLRAFLVGVLSVPLGVEAAQWLLGVEVLRRLCES